MPRRFLIVFITLDVAQAQKESHGSSEATPLPTIDSTKVLSSTSRDDIATIQIVREGDGAPISDAFDVTIVNESSGEMHTYRSDEQGRLTIGPGMPVGDYRIVDILRHNDLKGIAGLFGYDRRLINCRVRVLSLSSSTAIDPDKDLAVRRVYFASDRKVERSAANIAFTAEENPSSKDKITYGYADVSIPRDHHRGKLESPNWLHFEFDSTRGRGVTVVGVFTQTYDALRLSLKRDIVESPRGEALIFIHGYNTTFDESIERTAQLAYDLDFQGPAIAYSWPTSSLYVTYDRDRNESERTIPRLEAVLRELSQDIGARRIHVIAHSMGDYPLIRSLADFARRSHTGHLHFRNIVLAAPDVDQEVFERLSSAFTQSSDRVTIYASSQDRAIELSHIVNGFGRTGGYVSGEQFHGIMLIDASAVSNDLIGHAYFGDSRSVVQDIFDLINDQPKRGELESDANGIFRIRP